MSERKPTKQERSFKKYTSDRSLISWICEGLNNQRSKVKQPIYKMDYESKQIVLKSRNKSSKKNVSKTFNILSKWKVYNSKQLWYFILAQSEKPRSTKLTSGEDAEKMKPSFTMSVIANCCSFSRNRYGSTTLKRLKKKKYDSAILLFAICVKDSTSYFTDTC